MAGMMQAIMFKMVVLALFGSVVAVSPVQTFKGDCKDAGSMSYNFCRQAASSGEDCKHKLLTSSSAVAATYHADFGTALHPLPGRSVCDLEYSAGTSTHNDGACQSTGYGDSLNLRRGRGYAVMGDDPAPNVTCYAKTLIESFDVTHERIEELLVFQEDSSRAVMYNVLTGAMWVSAAITMTIGGVFVMRLRSLSMRGGGLVTGEPLLG